MPDMEKVIKAVEDAFDLVHSDFIGTDDFNETEWEQNKADALSLLKEQKKLIDVDELREKLGLAKDCAKCKQNARSCQYDSHFSLMDFCEMLDMAIEELTK